jgi:hypothetical protein
MKKLTPVCFIAILCLIACEKRLEPKISAQQIDELAAGDSTRVRVNVKDFGAKGDGITDDWKAIQAAEDFVYAKGGGVVYVPAGVYIVSEPFYHRSFVTLRGDGDASVIKNTRGKKGTGDGQFCIHIGNFSPSNYSQCEHYKVNDIPAGSNVISFRKPSDAAVFAPGQAVLIDTDLGFWSDDNKFKPYQAFINRIVSVDTVNGLMTVEDPVSADIHRAQVGSTIKFIAGTHNDTNKVYICQKPIIKDIRFESLGDWTMRFGVYKGVFDNISVKTTDVLAGNGFSHCKFRNIRAEYCQKIIEMAMYSHDTYVNGLDATWTTGRYDIQMKPLIKMGENVRDCSYFNLNIKSGDERAIGMVVRYEHAFNNKIYKSNFECGSILGSVVEYTTSDSLSIIVGNQTYDNTFILDSAASFIKLDNAATGSILANNSVTGNSFTGTVKKIAFMNNAENNIVENNIYKF